MNLQRIAKLVGPDALPEHQRLVLMAAEIIKNAFLQQNSFDTIDMYCSPQKQLWMLRLLVQFITRARNIIRGGGMLADLYSLPGLERLNRMKNEIANEDTAAMSRLEEQLNSSLEALERKRK